MVRPAQVPLPPPGRLPAHSLSEIGPAAARHCADGVAVAVEVTGVGGGAWTVTRVGGGWWVTRGSDQQAVARVALSSDTLWRLATRGITVEHARTLATVDGEPALAAAALTLVSVIQ